MKKIKAFWYIFKNSLFNVAYYKDLLNVRAGFSFKYFFTLGFFAAILTTLGVALPMLPEVKENLNYAFDYISNLYPEELVISAKDGKWEVNQPEPYAIPTPEFFKPENMEGIEYEGGFPENLIIFDHEGTINDLKDRNTFMIVNDVNLISQDGQGKIEAYPLDTIPDGEFDREDYDGFVAMLKDFARYLPFLLIFFVFIGTIFYYMIYRLMYLSLIALVLLAAGNLRGLKLSYRTYYKLGLHTLTLPLALEVLFAVSGVTVNFPMWFFGMNIIFGITVIYHLSNTLKPGELASGEKTAIKED